MWPVTPLLAFLPAHLDEDSGRRPVRWIGADAELRGERRKRCDEVGQDLGGSPIQICRMQTADQQTQVFTPATQDWQTELA